MNNEVKMCVDSKVNFFEEYFTVPADLQGEFDRFAQDVTALGENCATATEFEEKFAATGLSERFNGLIPKCSPKSRKMTKEEKQNSRRIAKDILRENKDELVKDALDAAASHAFTSVKDKAIVEQRKAMIENDTLADYTIAMNTVEDIGIIGGFLKNKFGRKKNK